MREEILENYKKMIETLDKIEILAAYLNWFIDNANDENELHYDVLECTTRFSMDPQLIQQFNEKLNEMLEKYKIERGIASEYFEEIGLRINDKIRDRNKQ